MISPCVGNFAGEGDTGFVRSVRGCVVTGIRIRLLHGRNAVLEGMDKDKQILSGLIQLSGMELSTEARLIVVGLMSSLVTGSTKDEVRVREDRFYLQRRGSERVLIEHVDHRQPFMIREHVYNNVAEHVGNLPVNFTYLKDIYPLTKQRVMGDTYMRMLFRFWRKKSLVFKIGRAYTRVDNFNALAKNAFDELETR